MGNVKGLPRMWSSAQLILCFPSTKMVRDFVAALIRICLKGTAKV